MNSPERSELKKTKPHHLISITAKKMSVRLFVDGVQIYFSLAKYGSLDRAIKAAMKYRDKLPDRMVLSKYNPSKKGLGKSGFAGVGLDVSHSGERLGWRAVWQEGTPGKRHQNYKRFLYSDHGHMALIRAMEYRSQMLKKHSPWIF